MLGISIVQDKNHFSFPMQIYPIKDPKTRTRLALIICNIKFDNLSYRKGAEVDLEQMKLLLEDLGYNVETETNLSSQVKKKSLFHRVKFNLLLKEKSLVKPKH